MFLTKTQFTKYFCGDQNVHTQPFCRIKYKFICSKIYIATTIKYKPLHASSYFRDYYFNFMKAVVLFSKYSSRGMFGAKLSKTSLRGNSIYEKANKIVYKFVWRKS